MKLTKLFKKYIVNKVLSSRDEPIGRKCILVIKIINLEKELDLTKKETAKVLKIPLKKLLAMENIDLSINVDDYQLALLELNQFKMDQIIDKANRSTVVK